MSLVKFTIDDTKQISLVQWKFLRIATFLYQYPLTLYIIMIKWQQ